MKKLSILVVTSCVMAGMVSVACASDLYVFEMLKKAPYKETWTSLQKASPSIPAWAKGDNVVATPAKPVTVEGKAYHGGTLCKPHDCGNNQMALLFEEGGNHIYGLLQEIKEDPKTFQPMGTEIKWIGKPSKAVQIELEKVLKAP